MSKKGIPSYTKFENILLKNEKTVADVVRETSVDGSTLSHWKAGDYAPKTEKLFAIARFLGVSLESLLD